MRLLYSWWNTWGSRRHKAPSGGGSSDPLDAIYAIDPNAKVWVHTRGLSAGLLSPVSAWDTANGNATLIQATTSKQPVRYADGLYWDGIDDEMTAHAIAPLFANAHSVITSVRDLSTANNIRTLWIAAQNLVSTSIREHVSLNAADGTAALSTRWRVLQAATATATTLDLSSLYGIGSTGGTVRTAYITPAPSSLGTGQVYTFGPSPSLVASGSWSASTFVPDLFTVGSQRYSTSGPGGQWQGTLPHIVVLTKQVTTLELATIYAALDAEGAL